MDKKHLPPSKIKREIEVIKPEEISVYPSKKMSNYDKSTILFSNGSKIIIEPEHISDLIKIGAKVVDGIISISAIREQGEQNVKKIKMEIEKIYAESETYVKKLEAESKDWNEKFNKKKELLFHLIAKIEANPGWSDDLKRAIISAIVNITNEKH